MPRWIPPIKNFPFHATSERSNEVLVIIDGRLELAGRDAHGHWRSRALPGKVFTDKEVRCWTPAPLIPSA